MPACSQARRRSRRTLLQGGKSSSLPGACSSAYARRLASAGWRMTMCRSRAAPLRPADMHPAGVGLNVGPAGLDRFTPARGSRDDEGDLGCSGGRQDRQELCELLDRERARSRPVVRGEARREKRLEGAKPKARALCELQRSPKGYQLLPDGVIAHRGAVGLAVGPGMSGGTCRELHELCRLDLSLLGQILVLGHSE